MSRPGFVAVAEVGEYVEEPPLLKVMVFCTKWTDFLPCDIGGASFGSLPG